MSNLKLDETTSSEEDRFPPPPPAYAESISTPNPTTTLNNHLSNLLHTHTTHLTQTIQTTHTNLSTQTTHLTPYIPLFLTTFSHTTLPKGTLYLIPANKIPRGAKLAGLDMKGNDEFLDVVEVDPTTNQGDAKDVKWPGDSQKEKKCTELTYWKNETLAKTLATEIRRELGDGGEGLKVSVVAEEVVFRFENAFGVWSTKSGFAVVMRIVIVRM